MAPAQNAAAGNGNQLRPAGGDDVEALVGAAAATRRAEFADAAADAVRPLDREDVAVVGDAAGVADDASRGRRGQSKEEREREESGALQWCSMTRSTMLYSFASSALMK
jgi:hypothetical protein